MFSLVRFPNCHECHFLSGLGNLTRQVPTKCAFFCHKTSPGIVPLQSHPTAGAERPRCEIEVDCPQGEAHLDQGASSQFTWDLGSGKHTGRQILQKMDEHKRIKVSIL